MPERLATTSCVTGVMLAVAVLPEPYHSALKEVAALVDVDPRRGTLDGDRLDILRTLVQAYEAKHYRSIRPTR